jgi:probable HAF family extracellular repeat protein
MKHALLCALTIVLALLGVCRAAWAQSFTGLGPSLPSGFNSSAVNVSGNGRVALIQVAGGLSWYRWTRDTGAQLLGGFAAWTDVGLQGISDDGTVIVGGAWNGTHTHAVRWAADQVLDLGVLSGYTDSYAYAVSGNGDVVVGLVIPGNCGHCRAIRWTLVGGMQVLSYLPGYVNGDAEAVNFDGSVIVGFSESTSTTSAMRWAGGGVQSLGSLPGSPTSFGLAVTSDGSTVFGKAWMPDGGVRAFRWTSATGSQDMGTFGGRRQVFIQRTNADGTLVTGAAENDNGADFASVVWTPSSGWVDVNSYLQSFGIDLTGWGPLSAHGVSADGLILVGNGTHNGVGEAWIADLHVACRADFNHSGILSTQDIFDFLNAWFAGEARADFNGVGGLTEQDIFDYITAWMTGC